MPTLCFSSKDKSLVKPFHRSLEQSPTEANWNPWQIWVNGMISHENIDNTAVRDVFDWITPPGDLYGMDLQGPPPN